MQDELHRTELLLRDQNNEIELQKETLKIYEEREVDRTKNDPFEAMRKEIGL